MPDTEFYRKYPPDPWGEELSANARVWKIYRDQQHLSHTGMLEGWNKTLDVLLIFAGLFSAVLTAFLIESYKALQPDYTQYVAAFLYAAAVSHNGTGSMFPELDTIVAPNRFVQTSTAQRWTNGLWFCSLVISLAVALLCILIKQWLDAYNSHVSAGAPSPIHWARRHSLYHRGLEKWGLPALISFLPLLLHMSLFLFFVGLIEFLLPLDGGIAYVLLFLVSCIAVFYIVSLVLPAWRVECPSYTPLLAQVLLAVAQGASTLAHIIGQLRRLAMFALGKPRQPLHAMARHEERWLKPILLRTRKRDAHVTRTISKYNPELDGHVLGTLIQLPIDSNQDTVIAACASLATLESPRTFEAIFRAVTIETVNSILYHCADKIPMTDTGFMIATKVHLRRASMIIRIDRFLPWFGDGSSALMQALGVEDPSGNQRNIDLLIQELQALSCVADIDRLPHRSACMRYLESYAQCATRRHPLGLSCFLLFFCAGRFTILGADTLELVRVLRSVELVLRAECSIEIPAHNGEEEDYILSVANGLWLMLAESPQYSIDNVTAQIVASQTLACLQRFYNCRVLWRHICGLSTFVRSPTFIRCVGTGNNQDTADSLARYMAPLWYMGIVDRATVRLEDYWECIAILLKLGWDCVLMFSPAGSATFSIFAYHLLFPVHPIDLSYEGMLSEGGPYTTRDDWYEPALAVFLEGPNAIATWNLTVVSHWINKYEHIKLLAQLALRISIVLCRRKRLGRANNVFVPAFFSGPFLLARFRERICVQHSGSTTSIHASKWWKNSYHEVLDDLAKHCLRLSPEHLMAICMQLEETGDEGSELRTRAVAFAQRIRDGSSSGGELAAECDARCACMVEGESTVAGGGAVASRPARWDTLLARFRPGRNASVTSRNV